MKTKKKKSFLIEYLFDGNGEITIEADSKEDAEEKWREGDYDEDQEIEWGESYEIFDIREAKASEASIKRDTDKDTIEKIVKLIKRNDLCLYSGDVNSIIRLIRENSNS